MQTKLEWFTQVHTYAPEVVYGDVSIQYISIVGLFIFLFFFLHAHKKYKNTNKRISYFFPLRSFFNILNFYCLFAFLCFCLVVFLCLFFVLLVLFCKSFCKKKKKFKTALITSFILLLTGLQVGSLNSYQNICLGTWQKLSLEMKALN